MAAGVSNPANTYQWYLKVTGGWSAINGATATSYTTPALTAMTEYAAVVRSGICETWSNRATISMCTYPAVMGGPPDWKIAKGQTARLEIIVSPAYDKTITWYEGESGNTSKPLTSPQLNRVLDVAPTVTTKYWAKVEHGGCTSRTTSITVQVCVPAIVTSPVGGVVRANTPKTLSVTTNSLPGETFQWFEAVPGGTYTAIAGATSSSYTAQTSVTKNYFARVTGTCGMSVDSAAATVEVCANPVVASVSGTQFIRSGQSASITVNATGNALTYQWYQGASGVITNPVAGATTSTATVTPSAHTTYWARVTSQATCPVDSSTVAVDVCTDPTVTTPAASPATVRSGQTSTLSVTASATTGSVTYQWYQGTSGTGTAISGATASTYTTPAITADTNYWVRVTRGACSVNSPHTRVVYCTLTAAINTPPPIASGQTITLTAAATNSRVPSPTFSWYVGQTLIGYGANFNVAPTTDTNYWVRVNDGTCTYDSAQVTVRTCVPTITSQPPSPYIVSGSTTLTVAASGTSLTYQWYQGASGVTSQPIAGAVSASLTVSPAVTTNYWVRVSGCNGSSADSVTATVSVCEPPAISAVYATPIVNPGAAATLTVSASGSSLHYQWYRGASGVTTNPVFTDTATVTFNPTTTDYYWVRVYNDCGSQNSSAVLQSVYPTITTQPADVTIPSGSTATLSVASSGTYPYYQWYQGSAPISGANAASYTTPPVTATTTYKVHVYSGSASVVSRVATVTVCAPPRINNYTSSGNTIYVMVASADLGNVYYDWYSGNNGDVANSTFLGRSGYYRTFYPTAPTKYWVRVWKKDLTCYKDTGEITLYP